MNIEVLVATMKQHDFSILKAMNIQTNAVIANQTDENAFYEERINNNVTKMINTTTIGVGLNRNFALLFSTGEVLLFSDDDMVFVDDYSIGIAKAYEDYPDADAIIFSADLTKDGEVIEHIQNRDEQAFIYNSLKYASWTISIKRSSYLKYNLSFNQLFGGGCLYGAGEDSLFIKDMFDKGLKIYKSSFYIGRTSRDTSTWFTGYNEKYIYDKGAWLACSFPKLKYLMCAYMTWRIHKISNVRYSKIFQLLMKGYNAFHSLQSV